MAETFRCGHPRTPENSVANGQKLGHVCRQCKNERARSTYRTALPSRSAPELAGYGQRGCDVDGCQGVHLARGFCRKHYADRKRRGEFGPTAPGTLCQEPGCDRPARARSLCKSHYQRAQRAGMQRCQRVNAGQICNESGCCEPAHANGQCRQHYNYWRAVERYGVDRDEYHRMVDRQDGRCAVCGSTDPGRNTDRWCIDHDHACCPGGQSCGRCVRGLLCHNCNAGLGHFDDDPDRLLAAAAYVLSRVDVLRAVGGEQP